MVRTPGAASISTSSASPATSSSGFARRIPRELPILTSFARTKTTPCRRAHIVATLVACAHCPALANAPDQKRAGALILAITSAPVFCILMLGLSPLINCLFFYLHAPIDFLSAYYNHKKISDPVGPLVNCLNIYAQGFTIFLVHIMHD